MECGLKVCTLFSNMEQIPLILLQTIEELQTTSIGDTMEKLKSIFSSLINDLIPKKKTYKFCDWDQ